jgi:hypothetical protein
MEYFAPPQSTENPFRGNQLLITEVITRLLNAHSPFLLTAMRPEMKAVLVPSGNDAKSLSNTGRESAGGANGVLVPSGNDAKSLMDSLLRIHSMVLEQTGKQTLSGPSES